MKRINMSEGTKEQLLKLVRWVIAIAATGIFAYFGIGNIPVPPPAEISVIVPGAAQEVDAPPSPTPEGLVEYGYQTACYLTDGGDKLQCDSGGEIEINEGATLDINGTLDIDLSAPLTIDGDLVNIGGGDYILVDGDNDLGVAGDFEVDTDALIDGDLTANTATITGTLDVGGIATFDGSLVDIGVGACATAGGDNDLCVAGDVEVNTGLYANTGFFTTTVDILTDLDVGGLSDLDDVDIDLTVGSELNIDGDRVNIGTGVCAQADGDNDLCVAADAEVEAGLYANTGFFTTTVDILTDLDVGGVSDLDDVDIDLTVGSELNIDGDRVNLGTGTCVTADADGDLCAAGDVEIVAGLYAETAAVTDTLDVGGVATFDGDQVNVGGGVCVAAAGDNDLCVAADMEVVATIYAEDVVVTNTLDVDGATTLDDLSIAPSSEVLIDGHRLNVGGGVCVTAAGDNDLCVAADVEIVAGLYANTGFFTTTVDVVTDLDVDGATTLDDLSIAPSSEVLIDGHRLNVGGGVCLTADTDNDLCVAGDVEIVTGLYAETGFFTDTLDVGGVATFDGDQVNVGGGVCYTAAGDNDLCVAADVEIIAGLYAETGFFTDTLDVGGVATFDGDQVNVGGGVCYAAAGDNDLCVAADVEVIATIYAEDGIITDTLSVGTWYIAQKQAALTIYAGSTITVTGTFQPITSSGNVTTSTSTPILAGSTDGQILILQNVGADNITIDGTGGNVECKNDVVLDDDDTLTLIWNTATWYCIATYDNS